jgi:hypothetical protein
LVIPLAWLILLATSLGNALLPVMFAFGILGRRWKGFMRPSSPASSPR